MDFTWECVNLKYQTYKIDTFCQKKYLFPICYI